MDKMIFISVFITVLIYSVIQIISSYKIICLNRNTNPLIKTISGDEDFYFRLSIISFVVMSFIFSIFFIPNDFSLYKNIVVSAISFSVGVVTLYEISLKGKKELMYLNMLMMGVNITLGGMPLLIMFLTIGF